MNNLLTEKSISDTIQSNKQKTKQNHNNKGDKKMTSEYEIKKEICEIGKRIYDRGMVAANDGNISVKLNDNEFLCTPTGVSKGFMTPEYICKVDRDGKVIQANGNFKPSSEIKMHMRVYKERPDVVSVVHAHPMYATGFAIAGIPLTQPIMPEAVITLGCVPIAEYGTPSTDEIPDAVSKYLQYYDAVLLENHGALAYSDSLLSAYHKMESVEFYAKLLYISKQLGGPKELSDSQVQRLYEIRRQFGMTGKHPANLCQNTKDGKESCHNCSGHGNSQADSSELVAEITKKVMEQLGLK
jgi:L-fuculose-phosphate aldolase